GAIALSSFLTLLIEAVLATSTEDMMRSINRPMALIPAPCMSRLLFGGLPQASGNTSLTAVQYVFSNNHMPSKSDSPVAIFRYGNRHPEGEPKLSWIIFTIDVSEITARLRSFFGVELRRISPQNGDLSSRLSRSHRAEGIFLASRLGGKDFETSGSNSVIKPRGRGRVLFTRRN